MKEKTAKNKLEIAIVEKVFHFERERSSKQLKQYVIVIAVGIVALSLVSFTLFTVLQQQQTLDLLQLFSEDSSTIQEFLPDTLATFYTETPKDLLFLMIICVILMLILVVMGLKNFSKMKKRLQAIRNHRQTYE